MGPSVDERRIWDEATPNLVGVENDGIGHTISSGDLGNVCVASMSFQARLDSTAARSCFSHLKRFTWRPALQLFQQPFRQFVIRPRGAVVNYSQFHRQLQHLHANDMHYCSLYELKNPSQNLLSFAALPIQFLNFYSRLRNKQEDL